MHLKLYTITKDFSWNSNCVAFPATTKITWFDIC